MIQLNLAKEEDIDTIAKLARKIWNEHYVDIVGQEQVDYMLEEMYSKNSLEQQMRVKKHLFYLIKKDETAIGFISVSSKNNSDFFLHKFYINQQKSNAGIGTEVLNLIIELIKPKTLTLTVNRQNFKSINFYFKNRFKIDRVEDFDIGHGYQMNDFVMVRKF
jgi:RimJ/RimL family protein N-acetyltransferase